MEHPDKKLLALAGMITGHASVLPEEVVEYYLKHRDQIPKAMERGFVLPTSLQSPQVPPPPTHNAVYEHLFGPIQEAVNRLISLSKGGLKPYECSTFADVPEPSGFVRQVYVPQASTVSELLEKLKSLLSNDPSCRFGMTEQTFQQLPHPMMRRDGWFLVDFGPTQKTSGYDAIRDQGDYVAGLVALAGYLMYPKLAMYAGRDYKGLTVPKQVVPGIQSPSADCCLVIGQGDFNPVRPYPCIVANGLDSMFADCALPRIVWPSL